MGTTIPLRACRFGEDDAGEVYVLTNDTTGPTRTTGRVYRLTAPTD